MCSSTANPILPEPPEELKCISEELAARIRQRITSDGPIPFSRYMEMALYEPGLGYYSAGLKKLGEGGDFVTSPELGDVFAHCLARQIAQTGEALQRYEIVEAGAGSGVLAADLLVALQDSQPPTNYRILERSAHLRQLQKETLSRRVPQWMDRISWIDSPPASDWQGVFLANEVLDALTVERFCLEDDGVRQLNVTNVENGFDWSSGPGTQTFQNQVQTILSGLERQPAAGYRSELNAHLSDWLHAVTESMRTGVALFIDYGYTRREYYLPHRRDGTLICHYQQRSHSNPFLWPGLTDISASVDFTALAEAAGLCGLEVSGYTSQVMFLLGCGLDKVMASRGALSERERISMTNQVRRLTLPGEMGERFQVMALSRGLAENTGENMIGFSLSDLRHRL